MENPKHENWIEQLSSPEIVDMADEWYEFATEDHFWIKSRFASLLKATEIQNLSDAIFLEIGCGNGMFIKQFESLQGVVVDGCDLNIYALNKIKKTKGKLYCLNIFDKPDSLLGKYDGVILMDIIEHIDDDSKFISAAVQYLKPQGLIIINVPATTWLFSNYDKAAGHKRRYSKHNLLELFYQNNITPLNIYYWGVSLIPIVLIRKLMLTFSKNENIIKNGFKPPNQILNRALEQLIKLENKMTKTPFIGTSLLAIGKYS